MGRAKLTVAVVFASLLMFGAFQSVAYASDPVYEVIDSPRIVSPDFCGAVFGNKQTGGTYSGLGGFAGLIKNPERLPLGFIVCGSPTLDNNYVGVGNGGTFINQNNVGAKNWVNIAQENGDGKYLFYSNNTPSGGGWGFVHAYASNTPIFYDSVEEMNSTGGGSPTVPINKNIEILKPTYATTTASTTFAVEIKFKTALSIDFRPTTTRHYEIVDAVTGELNYSYNYTLDPNTGENITFTATNTVPEGSKYIRAMYLDTKGNAYSEIDEVFFNVATNTYKTAFGIDNPRAGAVGLTQIDCGLFEFGCQIQKAIAFLFYPDANALDRFSSLWQTIAEKKPFGYVTLTINELKSLDTGGAVAFDLGDIPFIDAIFTPFRDLIGGILWALFAIYFYKNRLIHLDI
jgi:hypothetical protein